jgi:hypothetical protein
METDIKGDKRGLGREKRRKKGFLAQEAFGVVGAALSQPHRVLQAVVFEADCSGEAGSGAVGEGGIGDGGRGKGGKDEQKG